MKKCVVVKACVVAALVVVWASTFAPGQTPEELKRDIEALRKEMRDRQAAFGEQLAQAIRDSRSAVEARLVTVETERDRLAKELASLRIKHDDLEADFRDGRNEENLAGQIEEIVSQTVKFYQSPLPGQKPRSVFGALQGGLIFSGLFRMRFEHRNRNVDFSSGGLDDRGVRLDGRLVLGFGAVLVDDQEGNRITALTQIQGTGEFASNTRELNSSIGAPAGGGAFEAVFFKNATLYQAYLEFEGLIADGFRLRFGSQELTFGSQFVLGNDSFFLGLQHGAILTEWQDEQGAFKLSVFYAKESRADAGAFASLADDFDDDEMAGVYLHTEPAPDVTLEAYALYFNARSGTGGSDSFVTSSSGSGFSGSLREFIRGSFWTLGLRTFWSPVEFLGGHLSLNAEAAYQTGRSTTATTVFGSTRQSLHGWAAEFIANYRFDKEMQGLAPILTLAYYYAGGGGERTATDELRHVGFQPLFLNRHFASWDRENPDTPYFPGGGRLGNIDIVPSSNIHVVKAALSVSPGENIEVGLVYLIAATADNEGHGTGLFGQEIDLFGAYRYPGTTADITFTANLSLFFPDDGAQNHSNFLFFPSIPEAGNDVALLFFLQALIAF